MLFMMAVVLDEGDNASSINGDINDGSEQDIQITS